MKQSEFEGIDVARDDTHEFGGPWTVLKLSILKKYLDFYTSALKNQGFDLVYIDSFAGTGRCDVKTEGGSTGIDGSARIALGVEPPFTDYYFIELSKKKSHALAALEREFPNRRIHVLRDDANQALNTICDNLLRTKYRAVIFLDPFGMEVKWKTLETIAKTQLIDLWYLFPYAGLYRNAPRDGRLLSKEKANSLTRVLGTEEWRDVFYQVNQQQDMFGDESERRDIDHPDMLDFVSNRLKALFPSVLKPVILHQKGTVKSPKGPPLFALYFAVSNPSPKAIGLANKAANQIIQSS